MMEAKLIDSHCHLDLYPDPADLISKLSKSKIEVITMTNAPSVYDHCQMVTKQYQNIHTAIGLHPQLVRERISELPIMWEKLLTTRFVGEVGLDYASSSKSEQALQVKAFSNILQKCADEGNKIISIHSRGAAGEVIKIIGRGFPGTIIMHWFSGNLKEMRECIKNGYYFSINPAMAMSKKGQRFIKEVNPEYTLTESDGPFVRVDNRPTSPFDINIVIKTLSNKWKVSCEEVKKKIYRNYLEIVKAKAHIYKKA